MKKKILSWLIVMIMIFAIIPATSIPVLAENGTGVKFEMVPVGGGVYKLVFSAKTQTTINMISVVFSYDKTVIQPVMSAATGVDYDVATYAGTAATSTLPLKMLLATPDVVPGVIFGTPFNFAPSIWYDRGNRQALSITASYTGTANSLTNYVGAFEFYFRFLGGKMESDIKADTFKFETADDINNMLDLYYTAPKWYYGILLSELSGVKQYRWGCANEEGWETFTLGSIDEVINPYDVAVPPPAITFDDVVSNGGDGYVFYGMLDAGWTSFGFEVSLDKVNSAGVEWDAADADWAGAGFAGGKFGVDLSGDAFDGVDSIWLHFFASWDNGSTYDDAGGWQSFAW